jgi:hypothetical protein
MRVVRLKRREPRTHWVLLSVLLVLLLFALVVSGFVHGQVGESGHLLLNARSAQSRLRSLMAGRSSTAPNQSKAVCAFRTGMSC